MNLKSILSAISLIFSAATLPAATITDIAVRQRWPWSQNVDITYTLAGEKAGRIVLSMYSNGTKLTIPESALSGDLLDVSPGGPHTITFDPTKTAYTNQVLTNIRVSLATAGEPLYMIVNLAKSMADADQITYLTAYDITNGVAEHNGWEWGSFYHTGPNIDANWKNTIVWTGVTNDSKYATSNLVLRYVPAGKFTMGTPNGETQEVWQVNREKPVSVTLTKGYFIGIYELSQRQYQLMTGSSDRSSWMIVYWNGDPFRISAVGLTYNMLRGTNGTEGAYNWPANGHTLSPTSVLGMLQAKTGRSFDLPTEAQWEYACRAGTTGAWNDGTTCTNETVDLQLNDLGWYHNNSGDKGQIGGLKRPNGWGLYDMHGNGSEICLDWYSDTLSGGTDPQGPSSGSARVNRPQSFVDVAERSRAGRRATIGPDGMGQSTCCRVALALP